MRSVRTLCPWLLVLTLGALARADDGGVAAPLGVEGGFVHVRSPYGGVSTSIGRRTDGGTQTVERGPASCARLAWSGAGTADRLPLTLDRDRLLVDLLLRREGDTWRLYTLAVHEPGAGFSVMASCTTRLTLTDDPATPQALETSAGPVFRDAATCRASAGGFYERSCVGGTCRFDEGHARLFDLGPCEAVVKASEAKLNAIRNSEPARRLAALNRLQEVFRAGGSLYERREQLAPALCVRWRVKPAGPLAAHLSASHVEQQQRTTEEKDLTLRPLERAASEQNRSAMTLALDGGGLGMSGSSGSGRLDLLFGDERVLVGTSWYFFTRAACEKPNGP